MQVDQLMSVYEDLAGNTIVSGLESSRDFRDSIIMDFEDQQAIRLEIEKALERAGLTNNEIDTLWEESVVGVC